MPSYTILRSTTEGSLSSSQTSSAEEAVTRLKTIGVKGIDKKKTPKLWFIGKNYQFIDVLGKEVQLKVR